MCFFHGWIDTGKVVARDKVDVSKGRLAVHFIRRIAFLIISR